VAKTEDTCGTHKCEKEGKSRKDMHQVGRHKSAKKKFFADASRYTDRDVKQTLLPGNGEHMVKPFAPKVPFLRIAEIMTKTEGQKAEDKKQEEGHAHREKEMAGNA
jgi:hypothetical protein